MSLSLFIKRTQAQAPKQNKDEICYLIEIITLFPNGRNNACPMCVYKIIYTYIHTERYI